MTRGYKSRDKVVGYLEVDEVYGARLYELKSALIWLILVSIDRAMAELQNLNLNEKFLFCLICIIIV